MSDQELHVRASSRWLLVAAAAVVVLAGLAWFTVARSEDPSPGPATAAPVVRQMLQALENRDVPALNRLAPAGYVQVERDVRALLDRHAGIDASAVRFDIESDLAPRIAIAHLDVPGQPEGAWVENLIWDGSQWRLLLGHADATAKPGSGASNNFEGADVQVGGDA